MVSTDRGGWCESQCRGAWRLSERRILVPPKGNRQWFSMMKTRCSVILKDITDISWDWSVVWYHWRSKSIEEALGSGCAVQTRCLKVETTTKVSTNGIFQGDACDSFWWCMLSVVADDESSSASPRSLIATLDRGLPKVISGKTCLRESGVGKRRERLHL